jgi:hypothetical protein
MKRFLLSLGGICASAIIFAPTSSADEQGVSYEIMSNGKEFVCVFFDTQGASGASLNQIGQYYMNKGFTSTESAEIVSTSVKYWCKQYLPALHVAASNNSQATGSMLPPGVDGRVNLNSRQSDYVDFAGSYVCSDFLNLRRDFPGIEYTVSRIEKDGYSTVEATGILIKSVDRYCADNRQLLIEYASSPSHILPIIMTSDGLQTS